MSSNEKLNLNSTQGKEYEVSCIQCDGKTHHRVLVSADIEGSDDNGLDVVNWTRNNQIVQCGGCKTISFRTMSSNSEDWHALPNGEAYYTEYETLYPPRIPGRKGLGDDVRFLPHGLYGIYEETLKALLSDSPVLTGIGLRALVESVCKEKAAEGRNLYQQIEGLEKAGVLTPGGKKILHKIRTLGNDAAHEVKPHSDSQLAVAMDVIEHLLKDVYILPKKTAAEFPDDE